MLEESDGEWEGDRIQQKGAKEVLSDVGLHTNRFNELELWHRVKLESSAATRVTELPFCTIVQRGNCTSKVMFPSWVNTGVTSGCPNMSRDQGSPHAICAILMAMVEGVPQTSAGVKTAHNIERP